MRVLWKKMLMLFLCIESRIIITIIHIIQYDIIERRWYFSELILLLRRMANTFSQAATKNRNHFQYKRNCFKWYAKRNHMISTLPTYATSFFYFFLYLASCYVECYCVQESQIFIYWSKYRLNGIFIYYNIYGNAMAWHWHSYFDIFVIGYSFYVSLHVTLNKIRSVFEY